MSQVCKYVVNMGSGGLWKKLGVIYGHMARSWARYLAERNEEPMNISGKYFRIFWRAVRLLSLWWVYWRCESSQISQSTEGRKLKKL